MDAVFNDGYTFGGMFTDAEDSSQAMANIANHYNKVRYGRPDRTVTSLKVRLASPEEIDAHNNPYGIV